MFEHDWKITVYENSEANAICFEVMNLVSGKAKDVMAYPIVQANGKRNTLEEAYKLADKFKDTLIRKFIDED